MYTYTFKRGLRKHIFNIQFFFFITPYFLLRCISNYNVNTSNFMSRKLQLFVKDRAKNVSSVGCMRAKATTINRHVCISCLLLAIQHSLSFPIFVKPIRYSFERAWNFQCLKFHERIFFLYQRKSTYRVVTPFTTRSNCRTYNRTLTVVTYNLRLTSCMNRSSISFMRLFSVFYRAATFELSYHTALNTASAIITRPFVCQRNVWLSFRRI